MSTYILVHTDIELNQKQNKTYTEKQDQIKRKEIKDPF